MLADRLGVAEGMVLGSLDIAALGLLLLTIDGLKEGLFDTDGRNVSDIATLGTALVTIDGLKEGLCGTVGGLVPENEGGLNVGIAEGGGLNFVGALVGAEVG